MAYRTDSVQTSNMAPSVRSRLLTTLTEGGPSHISRRVRGDSTEALLVDNDMLAGTPQGVKSSGLSVLHLDPTSGAEASAIGNPCPSIAGPIVILESWARACISASAPTPWTLTSRYKRGAHLRAGAPLSRPDADT